MYERHVFVKLKEAYATDKGRLAVAAKTRTTLVNLPGVVSVAIGFPADAATRKSWDLSITVRFDSIINIPKYRDHPDHRRYVEGYLRPRMDNIKAWNFEVYE